MPNDERGRLDAAIDRAVRRMVQVDPRPGFGHRVSDRLQSRAGQRAWLLPLLATAAVFAVVVTSIVFLRSPLTRTSPQPQPQVASAPPQAALPAERPVATAPPTPAEPLRGARRRPAPPQAMIFGPRTDRVTAATINAGALAQTPDVPPAFAPVSRSTTPLEPIVIAPIELQPIAIAPVTLRTLADWK